MVSTGVLIGDPLEVEIFSKTGWNFLSRPDGPPSLSQYSPSLEVLSPSIWDHPSLPPSVDAVVTPSHSLSNFQSSILAIFRRFDFDSDLRLMSTIVLEICPGNSGQPQKNKMRLLTKGAPESVKERCIVTSVPSNFESQLEHFALNGDRVLACATRPLDGFSMDQILSMSRQEMESGLTMTGLVVLENKLKEETVGYLDELTRAGIRSVMVTGDNPLTAVAVARKCGPFFVRPERSTFLVDVGRKGNSVDLGSGCIIRDLGNQREFDLDNILSEDLSDSTDIETGSPFGNNTGNCSSEVSLAVTGRAFSSLLTQHSTLKRVGEAVYGSETTASTPTPLEMVAGRAGVFARMSPSNKADLIRCFQDLGYTVCMTGDGANDSSALKTADVGISIACNLQEDDSMAAAPSIAAPFSTHMTHIGAVPKVLSEGRCALVNATTMFKYMYFYALIQTTAVVLLYGHNEDLGEYQYLYGDLFVIFWLILVLPGSGPSKKLSKGRPEGNLLALPILISVYGQSLILVFFQICTFFFLQNQDWYVYINSPTSGIVFKSQDSTVLFLISSIQYTTIAMALSQSFGLFRAPVLSNLPLVFALTVQFIATSILILHPPGFALSWFQMVDLQNHTNFLFWFWFIALLNAFCFVFFERFAIRHSSNEPDAINPNELSLKSLTPKEHKQGTESFGKSAKSLPRFFAVQKAANPCWDLLASQTQ